MILGALLCVTVIQAQQPPTDWLIVPGERVGRITATTSESELESLFGTDNVEPVDVHIGEGFTEPGAAVFPSDPSRRIEVVWRDEARTSPKELRLLGDSSQWRTSEGISLGSTLQDIERLNGFPFRLAGFAFDYGGTITDCGRGRLRMLGCSDRDGTIQGRLVVLRLNPSAESRARAEYRQVLGDRDFSSGHPAMQALNPRVYQMIVFVSR
ncbi:MAG TPA: hypothetical protein VLK65_13775 [Vicinamibacteria bacterium]|nr:hypothetical protein [Vicinamibacteria bacterium]